MSFRVDASFKLTKFVDKFLVGTVLLVNLGLVSCSGGGGGSAVAPQPTVVLDLPAPNTATTYTKPTTFSNQLDQINATVAYARGYFGQDVTVAIVDTGLRTTHEAFSGRVVSGKRIQFSTLLTNSITDGDGHGTAMAGLIAGGLANFQSGVAPQAKIMPIQIANSSGQFDGSSAVAIQYAASQTIQIINYSLFDQPFLRFPYSVSYEGNSYRWSVPFIYEYVNELSLSTDIPNYGNIFADVDLVFVASAGNQYWNSTTGRVTLVNATISSTISVPVSTFISKAMIDSLNRGPVISTYNQQVRIRVFW